jgi:hypothetical protein
VELPSAEAARITQVLAGAGLYLSQLRPEEQDLESVFLKLTEDPDPLTAEPDPEAVA